MGIARKAATMEGWLYLNQPNRLGLQSSRKRYFVLQGKYLDCFKGIPQSNKEDPLRSTLIDSQIHVADNGRGKMNKNIFYTFTLYNAFNQNSQLKLGAKSSEEAAMWIRSIAEASLKDRPDKGDHMACSGKRGQSLRLSRTKNRSRVYSADWTTFWSAPTDTMESDVNVASPWTIFGYADGLRLFKAKDGDFLEKNWDYHPAITAVAVVDANSDAIFHTLMSLSPSRSEWDFCLSHGRVVEHLNGNSDIIHKNLHGDWLPRGMTRRDFVLQRYWRREDDGTYAIVYNSVFHPSCPPEKGYIRAHLKSGGYVICPVNQGKESVVKHMLAIDWKSWRSYLFSSSGEYITIRMLARVAALREFFRAKHENGICSNYALGELIKEISLPQSEKEDIKLEADFGNNFFLTEDFENNKNEDSVEEPQYQSPVSWDMDESFLQLSDMADEFFDVDQSEAMWPSNEEMKPQDECHPKISTSTAARHLATVQEKSCVALLAASVDDMAACSYGTTLPKDPNCTRGCSWASADPSTFLIRGESYFQDHQKIKANSTLTELVGADWLTSDKREDNLGGRPGGIVQKYASQGIRNFFFIVNMQVPGYSLALYYMMDSPLENAPLLKNFVKGNDAYRNSRFKLIPFVPKGSWIVKQTVGKKGCLMGQALKLNYFQGRNYFEIDVDVGSSAVARGVSGLLLKYLNNLVIELAFLIQGNMEDEHPEELVGTCRLSHLDVAKAIPIETLS